MYLCYFFYSALVLVYFRADWAPQCHVMDDVVMELANRFVQALFVKVEAESVAEVSHRYGIAAVPSFVFIKNKQKIDSLDGANPPELTKKVQHHVGNTASPAPPAPEKQTAEDLNKKLKTLISSQQCMVFIKGSPQEPRCGFSKQLVQIFTESNIQFSSFNILTDDTVRQGLKKYSDWPTYPQIYLKGELIGGLDIIKEMKESGDLDSTFPKVENIDDRLRTLVSRSPVMVFMKGEPEAPRCGFSRTLISILKENGVQFDSFDILTDNDVRQGLKKYSNWPTYPQVYVKGDLIGGLDIIKELNENGELLDTLES
ncbi:glutaredoxin-3-like isoform X2 [Anneissia japonica]|uniref:glutaredoxin-3-like isoform X2 n=1 Tax=Anneissia japonica TaxID=1529436 RepID=UPI0014255487|nr:glutaredoxin-3-like isoform X2 [Anneissia japonica]